MFTHNPNLGARTPLSDTYLLSVCLGLLAGLRALANVKINSKLNLEWPKKSSVTNSLFYRLALINSTIVSYPGSLSDQRWLFCFQIEHVPFDRPFFEDFLIWLFFRRWFIHRAAFLARKLTKTAQITRKLEETIKGQIITRMISLKRRQVNLKSASLSSLGFLAFESRFRCKLKVTALDTTKNMLTLYFSKKITKFPHPWKICIFRTWNKTSKRIDRHRGVISRRKTDFLDKFPIHKKPSITAKWAL